jgi:hypothetical protein
MLLTNSLFGTIYAYWDFKLRSTGLSIDTSQPAVSIRQTVSGLLSLAKIQLTWPACTAIGEKVTLSRRIGKHWCLIGGCIRMYDHAVSKELQVGELCNVAQY